MSEAALRDRAAKRHWAEPGSRHDRLVRGAKLGLPLLGVALLLTLAIAPFEKEGEVSFILDKKEVEKANERMRIEAARYVGEDSQGRRFVLTADRAIQPTSDEPVVAIEGMRAKLALDDGALGLAAARGRYDLDAKTVRVDGPLHVAGPDGFSIATRDVTVDLGQKQMRSAGQVSGTMALGQFSAGSLWADVDQRVVRLDGGVRLKIRQGAVR
jgi:lipopolysaccharide export system protein LptC